ncbi:lipopolysaccharide assembly protein LapA domain-containing protein [Thermocrinis sp.]|uniref:lipopolysaccharide assembly protein LapA domain-containing protein n=1 Tax=Thermocrinis sp. TaxID=2024383 RepID=UPI003C008AC1
MRFIKLILLIFLIALFLVFVFQNAVIVEISFFNYKGYAPLFVLVLFSVFIGFLFAFLYFMPREWSLRRIVENLKEGVERLNRGLFLKAEQSFQGNPLMEAFACYSAYEREDINKLLSLSSPICALMLLKLHHIEESQKRFERIIEQEPENLLALKGLRDINFLKGNLKDAVELQERVLKNSEKWEREHQKKIMAELMASLYITSKDEDHAEKAFDIYRTPLTYSARILAYANSGKEKDAIKLFEKSFEDGFHNQVLMILLRKEALLTKLMDIIERRRDQINTIVLALAYLRLGLFSKVKPLLEVLPDYYRTLAISSFSHREEDRMCARILEESLKAWECVCGTRYKEYTPMCANCLRWNKIELKL